MNGVCSHDANPFRDFASLVPPFGQQPPALCLKTRIDRHEMAKGRCCTRQAFDQMIGRARDYQDRVRS